MKNSLMLAALVFVIVAAIEVWEIGIASSAPATLAKPTTLRMTMPGEPRPDQFSPLSGFTTGQSEPIILNVMEPLVDVGKKGEPVPKLATKWERRDSTTWRFYLRKGVKFHNGADFTARDVVELAKWNFEEKNLSKLYQRIPVKEAKALDDYTVDLIFEKPQPLLLILGRLFLISPLAISRDNRKMAETLPMGTGPYRFVEWKKGQYIKLTKFDGYWGQKPQIDDVEIIFRAEEGVRLAALMAGETDWVYGLGPEQARRAPKIVHIPSPETVLLIFDESVQKDWTGVDPIFADKRLRLAVEYTIDRKALVALYGGFITPSLGQFASPNDFGFNPNLKSRPYDLEKAKALVKEAGAVGKTITFVGPSDRFIKGREVAEAIAYMIEQTGLKVKLMLLPHVEVDKYKKTEGENRKYAADIIICPTDTLMEVESRYPTLFVKGGVNYALNDLEPTRLYKELLSEIDIDKRGKKVGDAWTYLYEQAHYVPIFKLGWIWGVAKNLEWNVDIAGRPFIADMRFTD